MASLTHSDLRVAGHVHQVQCIRAPGPEMLKSVELPADARLEGIDINGFYAAREDFPPIP